MSIKDNNIVILASDHNGVELKDYFVKTLRDWGYIPIDLGPYKNTESVDYVDYAKQVGSIISSNQDFKGVLICGTGVGMSIVANRFSGVRAALVHNIQTASKCREHNNSNILCLGSWINKQSASHELLRIWIQESFGEGRHNKRLSKIPDKVPNKIVFTNGVFDIIHTGHIELINYAKRLGNKLIVGINSDDAVKRLKGEDRPINNQYDRKKVLESLGMVDQVIIFDDIDPRNIREALSPNILVKGGEWTKEEVRKRDRVSPDIEINIYPFVRDYSTTNTIKKIYGLNAWQKKS